MSIVTGLSQAFQLSPDRCAFIEQYWQQFSMPPTQGILEYPGAKAYEPDLSLCYPLDSLSNAFIKKFHYLQRDVDQLNRYDFTLKNLWLEYDGENPNPSWYLQFSDEHDALLKFRSEYRLLLDGVTTAVIDNLPAGTGIRYIARMEGREEHHLRFVLQDFPLNELPFFLKTQQVSSLSLSFLSALEELIKISSRTSIIYSPNQTSQIGIEIHETNTINIPQHLLSMFHPKLAHQRYINTINATRLRCGTNHFKYAWNDVRKEQEPVLKTYCSFLPLISGLNPDTW